MLFQCNTGKLSFGWDFIGGSRELACGQKGERQRSHPWDTLALSEVFLTLSLSHGFVMPGTERAVTSAVTGSKENVPVVLVYASEFVSWGGGCVRVEMGEQPLGRR